MANLGTDDNPSPLGIAFLKAAQKWEIQGDEARQMMRLLASLSQELSSSAASIIASSRDYETAMQKLESLNEAVDEPQPRSGARQTRQTTARAGQQSTRRAGPPAAAVGDDEDGEDEKKDEGKEARSGFRPYVRIAAIVVAVLIVVGIALWFLFLRAPAAPKPTTLGAPTIATAAPAPVVLNPAPSPGTPQAPIRPWFLSDDQDKLNVLFTPPMNFGEVNHLGWWLVNLMIFVVMRHLRAEAIERGEPRDYAVVRNGITVLIVLLAFGDVVSMKLLQVCKWFDPNNCGGVVPLQIATYFAWGFGIAVALGLSSGASMGGRYDLSPLAVGSFITGTVVKQVLTNPVMVMVGTGLQVIGVILHIWEIFRHRDERWQASTILVLSFAVALGVRYLIEAAFWWGLKSIPQAEWSGPFASAIAFVYRTRAIPAFGLAILVGLGLVASTVGLGRMSAIIPEQYRERIGTVVAEASDSLRHDARIAFLMGAVVWLAIGLV